MGRGFESCRGHFAGGRRVSFGIVHVSVFKGRRGWPSFFLRVASAHVVVFAFACAPVSLCGALRGFESPVRTLGRLRRASPREARTACFPLVFGTRGVARVLWQ